MNWELICYDMNGKEVYRELIFNRLEKEALNEAESIAIDFYDFSLEPLQ